jgi:hypothetical protein
MGELTAFRRFAEDAAVVLTGMGLPPATGKLLGWLLICDPPQQTSAELTDALGLSKGSVSTGVRVLQNAHLVRRVTLPGRRGFAYEMVPDAFLRVSESENYRVFRELMERGLTAAGGEDAPGAERLRQTRDFYAFVERELPNVVARFKREYPAKEAKNDG